jgi:hypothetical protein
MRPTLVTHSHSFLIMSPLLVFVFLSLGCRPHPVELPTPCTGNGTIYSSSDSALLVHPPHPRALIIPSRSIPGSVTLRLLISPTGEVLRDSTRVLDSSGPEADKLAREAAEATFFKPAELGGCTVFFWFDLRITSL